jgi:hypothetical protein
MAMRRKSAGSQVPESSTLPTGSTFLSPILFNPVQYRGGAANRTRVSTSAEGFAGTPEATRLLPFARCVPPHLGTEVFALARCDTIRYDDGEVGTSLAPMSKIFHGLLERTPLVLIILGAGVILIGAAGGISKLPWGLPDLLLKDAWAQIVVECLGGLLCIFAGWFLVRELRTDGPTNSDLKKDYGLKITSHGANAAVQEEFEIRGRYKKRPPSTIEVRLFVQSPHTGDTWPNRRKIEFDDNHKEWTSSIRPGGNSGEKKILGIALVGKNARALCDYYHATADRISSIRKERSQLAKRLCATADRLSDPKSKQELREVGVTLGEHVGVPGIPNMSADFVPLQKITVTRM